MKDYKEVDEREIVREPEVCEDTSFLDLKKELARLEQENAELQYQIKQARIEGANIIVSKLLLSQSIDRQSIVEALAEMEKELK